MDFKQLLSELRKEPSKDYYSYVDVMPGDEKDPLELTPEELAAIQSANAEQQPQREEEPKHMRLPPAQKPGISQDYDDAPAWSAGVPGESDYRDRLNTSQHVDKLIANQQQEIQKKYQEDLKSGNSKIKATNARRQADIRDARVELNKEINQKAMNSWADAAAGWISKSKR